MTEKLDVGLSQVINTEKVLLPSVLTAVIGKRPQRYLATSFSSEG